MGSEVNYSSPNNESLIRGQIKYNNHDFYTVFFLKKHFTLHKEQHDWRQVMEGGENADLMAIQSQVMSTEGENADLAIQSQVRSMERKKENADLMAIQNQVTSTERENADLTILSQVRSTKKENADLMKIQSQGQWKTKGYGWASHRKLITCRWD